MIFIITEMDFVQFIINGNTHTNKLKKKDEENVLKACIHVWTIEMNDWREKNILEIIRLATMATFLISFIEPLTLISYFSISPNSIPHKAMTNDSNYQMQITFQLNAIQYEVVRPIANTTEVV